MKSLFAVRFSLILTLLLFVSLPVISSGFANCTSTEKEPTVLENKGYQVVKTKCNKKVLYIIAPKKAPEAKLVVPGMTQLVRVGAQRTKTHMIHTEKQESFQFLNLLFNFI